MIPDKLMAHLRAGQLSRKNELTQFNSLKKDFNSIQLNSVTSKHFLQLNSIQFIDPENF